MNIKKNYVLFFFVLSFAFFTSAFASPKSCYEKLTKGHESDSSGFQINTHDLSQDYYDIGENDHMGRAYFVIRTLVAKLGCNPGKGVDINFSHIPLEREPQSRCSLINNSDPNTHYCYVETNLGKFTVMWNEFDCAFIIFSRWD